MQTNHYKTPPCVSSPGNMVNLEDFRQKLSLSQRDSLARQPEGKEPSAFSPVVLTMSRAERRRARQARRAERAWLLDVCASVSIIVMTLVFMLWMIF